MTHLLTHFLTQFKKGYLPSSFFSEYLKYVQEGSKKATGGFFWTFVSDWLKDSFSPVSPRGIYLYKKIPNPVRLMNLLSLW